LIWEREAREKLSREGGDSSRETITFENFKMVYRKEDRKRGRAPHGGPLNEEVFGEKKGLFPYRESKAPPSNGKKESSG